ncbi:MAG TPA: YugN-like family protein [Bacillales bacterium]|nr:YugN-like family protein [Bacillales bacterium]
MIALESKLEGARFPLVDLEAALEPIGFTIGSNWDYDHGSLDCKINEEDGYLFLRIPFRAVEGSLDADGAIVQIGPPFLLNHKYESGLDEEVATGVISGFTNQFQEPVDKDSEIPPRHTVVGKQWLQKAEEAVLS